MFHDFRCFNQSCVQDEVCGSNKMREHFAGILNVLGAKSIEYFEHVEVDYVRSDLKKVIFYFVIVYAVTCNN